ncbi:ABC dipeptide/oligopeptide/nickel transport, ATPase component [Legionella busanensis]|uniref:ABC dipeptide/oligopeptide/nickel transport, ATPase component n=1 Tax=Legionella busanensis TaxID=190655 RepID=A0A378JLW8_9GAMM|nr:ABC transporter ATP-binding protein [Legionella busanensis]STX52214.1 ABC dipeptide/oligopeptide/nickel transport, ATPase component [Legionella busanensis]
MDKLANVAELTVAFETDQGIIITVDEINFALMPGETLALLGESGSGKSLTALAMMRLLPNNAAYSDKSTITIAKQDILSLPERQMRHLRGQGVAIIFQEPMTALNPVLPIKEQLAEALLAHQELSANELKQRMIDLLHKVEISEPELRLQQYPHQLSGGQKQRIVIAMALANNPKILIADEPTTALDVVIQTQILTLLKKLQQETNMSILLITHDLSVVKAMADKVCVMYAGQIVEEATVTEFFKCVKHPYSQQLLASLPHYQKRNQFLSSIAGSVPTMEELPSGCRFHPRCAHVFSPCAHQMPILQPVNNQLVRCHLYPETQELPPLPEGNEEKFLDKSNQELLLEVKNLKVYYHVGKGFLPQQKKLIKAVDDLSFKLYKGKTLALVGESGCGKTTVSRALLHLLPITNGEVNYRGQSVSYLRSSALKNYRKKVQIIFQDPYASMNPRLTVNEILAEGMVAQGLKSDAIKRRQLQLLDYVNLPQTSLERYPHQFSGGQRQRICIARALAIEPEVLVCDEPTSALDVSVQAQLLNLLKRLQAELGIAYLFITHNMGVVSYFADDLMVMKAGKIIEQGPCEEVFAKPKHDYTRQLLDSVLVLN